MSRPNLQRHRAPAAAVAALAFVLAGCGREFALTEAEAETVRQGCLASHSTNMLKPWIDEFCGCYVANYTRFVSASQHAVIAATPRTADLADAETELYQFCVR